MIKVKLYKSFLNICFILSTLSVKACWYCGNPHPNEGFFCLGKWDYMAERVWCSLKDTRSLQDSDFPCFESCKIKQLNLDGFINAVARFFGIEIIIPLTHKAINDLNLLITKCNESIFQKEKWTDQDKCRFLNYMNAVGFIYNLLNLEEKRFFKVIENVKEANTDFQKQIAQYIHGYYFKDENHSNDRYPFINKLDMQLRKRIAEMLISARKFVLETHSSITQVLCWPFFKAFVQLFSEKDKNGDLPKNQIKKLRYAPQFKFTGAVANGVDSLQEVANQLISNADKNVMFVQIWKAIKKALFADPTWPLLTKIFDVINPNINLAENDNKDELRAEIQKWVLEDPVLYSSLLSTATLNNATFEESVFPIFYFLLVDKKPIYFSKKDNQESIVDFDSKDGNWEIRSKEKITVFVTPQGKFHLENPNEPMLLDFRGLFYPIKNFATSSNGNGNTQESLPLTAEKNGNEIFVFNEIPHWYFSQYPEVRGFNYLRQEEAAAYLITTLGARLYVETVIDLFIDSLHTLSSKDFSSFIQEDNFSRFLDSFEILKDTKQAGAFLEFFFKFLELKVENLDIELNILFDFIESHKYFPFFNLDMFFPFLFNQSPEIFQKTLLSLTHVNNNAIIKEWIDNYNYEGKTKESFLLAEQQLEVLFEVLNSEVIDLETFDINEFFEYMKEFKNFHVFEKLFDLKRNSLISSSLYNQVIKNILNILKACKKVDPSLLESIFFKYLEANSLFGLDFLQFVLKQGNIDYQNAIIIPALQQSNKKSRNPQEMASINTFLLILELNKDLLENFDIDRIFEYIWEYLCPSTQAYYAESGQSLQEHIKQEHDIIFLSDNELKNYKNLKNFQLVMENLNKDHPEVIPLIKCIIENNDFSTAANIIYDILYPETIK